MSLRAVDPRTAVALTVMSLALFTMLRKSGALRCLPALKSFREWPFQNVPGKNRLSGIHKAVGPEGTDLPAIMHRVVGPDELKVRVAHGKAVF